MMGEAVRLVVMLVIVASLVGILIKEVGKRRRGEVCLDLLYRLSASLNFAERDRFGYLHLISMHSSACGWNMGKSCDCGFVSLRSIRAEASDWLAKIGGTLLLLLCLSGAASAETPTTTSGVSAFFAAERIMSSTGPAQDEAAGVAFGQVGFGRFGLGGWVLVTGTLQSNQLDVTKVRVLELALAPHWYAYQAKGVAIGPTLVLSSQYGYNTSGEPLVKRSAVTWGGGLHLGGKGSWATLLYGEHEVVGPRAFMGIAHLALSDSTALNADLAQAGGVYQVRLRACYGKR
jgi:hypothetical protein